MDPEWLSRLLLGQQTNLFVPSVGRLVSSDDCSDRDGGAANKLIDR